MLVHVLRHGHSLHLILIRVWLHDLRILHPEIVRLEVHVLLQQIEPLDKLGVFFEEPQVLGDELVDEDGGLVPAVLWEVVLEQQEADVSKELLTLDHVMNVLVVQA